MRKIVALLVQLCSFLLLGSTPGEGAPPKYWRSIASRRIDPSRPWLRPSNNWGQGFGQSSSSNVHSWRPRLYRSNKWARISSGRLRPSRLWGQASHWKPVIVSPDEVPAFFARKYYPCIPDASNNWCEDWGGPRYPLGRRSVPTYPECIPSAATNWCEDWGAPSFEPCIPAASNNWCEDYGDPSFQQCIPAGWNNWCEDYD